MFQNRRSFLLFSLMFSIVTLLHADYAILRSARNALAVADLGGSAKVLPWFELCGTMPGAILMTIGLTWLLNRFSIQRVFLITLSIFIGFFLTFVLFIYPVLSGAYLPIFGSMLFFVMAELWKIALFAVLFWGFVNQYIPLDTAKSMYAPLMLGVSIGTICAGPLISFCTSTWAIWAQSLTAMMVIVAAIGALAAVLFLALWKQLSESTPQSRKKDETLSVWESFRICCRSKYLLLLAWLTVADYIAYALGEVVFLDILKQRYPDPRQYCDFMGTLTFWNGILTAISALLITPLLLRRCRWMVASLVTPICLLLTEGAFFFSVWRPLPIESAVFAGAIFFCVVRAAKYTLFDTSKEISFLLLPPLEKMQGKLVIDGMCARLGRGSGSLFSIILIQFCGGVLASVPIAGLISLAIATSCVAATSSLGLLVDKRTPVKTT
jgi:AAA family ATP:ADP antiporter